MGEKGDLRREGDGRRRVEQKPGVIRRRGKRSRSWVSGGELLGGDSRRRETHNFLNVPAVARRSKMMIGHRLDGLAEKTLKGEKRKREGVILQKVGVLKPMFEGG